MTTLLMRMRAPMMSWGDHSRFTNRDTRREPTKSAVIGLLCAAIGRSRWEPVHDLTSLKMGVRVNREGVMLCDYHTIITNESNKDTVLSERYYIADADYLVGLEGEMEKLTELNYALQNPQWQLYFGRKSFLPSRPIHIGIVNYPLEQALKEHSYELRNSKHHPPSEALRYVLEVSDSPDIRQDVPLDWQKRLFGSRCVKSDFHKVEKTCLFQN
jgi:CRISPR system Cascade subunit CasD